MLSMQWKITVTGEEEERRAAAMTVRRLGI
jgi:hypothetical protein